MEGKRDYATQEVLYEITCNACKDPVDPGKGRIKETRKPGGQGRHNYIVMTRTSIHNRMLGHLQGQRSKSKKNPLYRHDVANHSGEPQEYTTRIILKEKNLLPLYINEGLYIERQKVGTTMNDRNEHGRGTIIRLTASRDIT